MITVRDEIIGDQDEIQLVDKAATATLRQTYRPNKKAICNKAKIHTHCKKIVAIFNNKIVGTADYYIKEQYLMVIGLGVHPDFRRQGIARKLIQSLEKIGEIEGVNCLRLHTVKQTGNVDIFRRLGFQIVTEQIDDFSESDIYTELLDVEMEKQLLDGTAK